MIAAVVKQEAVQVTAFLVSQETLEERVEEEMLVQVALAVEQLYYFVLLMRSCDLLLQVMVVVALQ